MGSRWRIDVRSSGNDVRSNRLSSRHQPSAGSGNQNICIIIVRSLTRLSEIATQMASIQETACSGARTSPINTFFKRRVMVQLLHQSRFRGNDPSATYVGCSLRFKVVVGDLRALIRDQTSATAPDICGLAGTNNGAVCPRHLLHKSSSSLRRTRRQRKEGRTLYARRTWRILHNVNIRSKAPR